MTGALAGRHALVTGGANGIGAAIARAFVREGARTTILDRDSRAGEAMAGGCGLTFIEADKGRPYSRAVGALIHEAMRW